MNKKGFTLIELLVVIAIIGILSSLAIVSLASARKKAYDAQIKNDLGQIRVALESYAAENGSEYPTQANYATAMAADGIAALKPPTCIGTGVNDYYAAFASGAVRAYGQTTGAYSLWAKLCAEPTKAWCIDSTGASRRVTLPTAAQTVCGAES